MSKRINPIVTNETYHIFNRGNGGQQIFYTKFDYQRFIDLVDYYRYSSPKLRFSFYCRLNPEAKKKYLSEMRKENVLQVKIFAFCLMPNHYHFVIKELLENGIRKFIANIQNSYVKFTNTKNKIFGSLFPQRYKNVRVENEPQFVHLIRYVHLNPLTSFVITRPEDLDIYQWSSFPSYFNKASLDFLDKDDLLSLYKDEKDLESFTKDQIDYQRKLNMVKHLSLEI